MTEKNPNKSLKTSILPIIFRVGKWLFWISGMLVLLLVGLAFLIQTSAFQKFATQYANNYLQSKTQQPITIGAVRFDFDGALHVQNIFVPDAKGDTLLSSNDLKIKIPLLPLLNQRIVVKNLQWQGLMARISVNDAGISNYNYLIEAFATNETEIEEPHDVGDSEAQPWDFELGAVVFRDFDLVYDDVQAGIFTAAVLDQFALSPRYLDFETFKLGIDRLMLEGVDIKYHQTKPAAPDTIASEPLDLILALGNATVKNFQFDVQLPDGTTSNGKWEQLRIAGAHVTLADQKIWVQKIGWQHSSTFVQLPVSALDSATAETPKNDTPAVLPDWEIKIADIDFYNLGLVFINGQPDRNIPVFQPDYLRISNLDLKADFELHNQTASLNLHKFRFDEGNGFALNNLQFQAYLQEQQFSIYDFVMETPHLLLKNQSALVFQSLDALVAQPLSVNWETNLELENFTPGDWKFFSTTPLDSSLYTALMKTPKSLRLLASGSNNEISVQDFSLQAFNNTRLQFSGLVENPYDSSTTNVIRSKLRFSSTKNDFASLLPADAQIPDSINVQVIVFGKLSDINADLQMQSDWGKLRSQLQIDLLVAQPQYDFALAIQQLNLPKILGDTTLSTVNLTASAVGAGLDVKSTSKFDAALSNLKIGGYAYQPIKIEGKLQDEKAVLTLAYQDSNAHLGFETNLSLAESGVKGRADFDVKGINFNGLKLTTDDLRAAMVLSADFETDQNNWQLRLNGTEGRVIKNGERYPINKLLLMARSNENGSYLKLDSDILDLLLESNLEAHEIVPVIQNQILAAFDSLTQRSSTGFLTAEATIKQSKILSQVLVPGLEKLEPGTFALHIDESQNIFDANMRFPEIGYGTLQIKDLQLNLDQTQQGLVWALQFSELHQLPIVMHQTQLSGRVEPGSADFGFDVRDFENQVLYQIQANITKEAAQTVFHIAPENLVLNKQIWQIPAANALVFRKTSVSAETFDLQSNAQKFGLQQDPLDSNKIDFVFEDFQLSALTALVNAESKLADGQIDGTISLLQRGFGTAFLADLAVNNLVVMDVPTGKLTLVAENLSRNVYNLAAQITGEGLSFSTNGTYRAQENGNYFDLKADLYRADLAVFEAFSKEFVTETSGYLSGNFVAKGYLDDLNYNGQLQFNKTRFKVNDLNTHFELSEERVALADNQVRFQNFTMRDRQGNPATLNGSVDLSRPALPQFDLRLQSKNFQLLNSSREHNDLFYGDLLVDLQMRLTGNGLAPIIKTNIKLNKGTSLTFIVPESELAEIERDGVVQFVNMREPEDPLTQLNAAKTGNVIKGIQLQAQLDVDRETEFKVVVDERSGDYLQMRGQASLLYEIAANGRTALFGQYEVNEGRYELSFYDLVRRRFDFKKGSTINWTGDPLGAALDLSAIYNVKTAPRDLMAAQISGADEATRTKYNQKLPFEVYLNIKGAITSPAISFQMDMPQNSRGELGGNVYAQVQQLNEDPSQLNKQVFALLVLGSFIPETGGTATGATSAVVRSSVSQLMSDQLNNLSDKYIKGIDIDLGLNSYTDYRTGAAKDRTQLNVNVSKQLLDDRLLISVGSNLELEGERTQNQRSVSDILGNVNVEYLLTPAGNYRLKAFRRNQFEGVLDGQIITTGVSLRYSKEFNRFREIFKTTTPPETTIVEDLPTDEPNPEPSQEKPQQETPYRTHEPEE